MRIKESIIIKNVGPIKEVAINDIKPFTVFIGSSASGKSSIMKIVALMRYIYKMVNIRSYLKNSNISQSPFRLRFDSLLHDGLETMIYPTTEIVYTVEKNGNSYSIEYKNKKLYANVLVANNDLIFLKESFIAETRNMIPTWSSKVSSNKGAELGFYFHETYRDFNDATDSLKEFDLSFLNMKMKIQKTKTTKQFLLEDKEENTESRPFELRHASSGLQTAIPLLSVLHYFSRNFSFKDAFQRSVLTYLFEQDRLSDYKPSIERSEISNYIHIHIEEPELSLDPNSQRELLSAMLREAFHFTAEDRKLGMMIATHSPYIVNQLNVFLKAGYSEKARQQYPYITEESIAVYSVGDGTTKSLMAKDNNTGQALINTIDLSDPMTEIYNAYLNIE